MDTPTRVYVSVKAAGDRYADKPWEIAAKRVTPMGATLHVWHVADFCPSDADPAALAAAGFYDRHPFAAPDRELAMMAVAGPDLDVAVEHRVDYAAKIAVLLERLTRDAVLICCTPTFDASRLAGFLATHGYAPTWDPTPVDALAYAAGYVDAHASLHGTTRLGLPHDPVKVGRVLGVALADFGDPTTALAAAHFAEALVDAVWQNRMPHQAAGSTAGQ